MEIKAEINNTQMKKLLKSKRNILVFGQSGYGKSAAVYEYAKENGLKVIDFNLAVEMPENVGGIPKVTDEGYFKKLLDSRLAPLFQNQGEGYILFLDEITQCNPEVANALYSICHPDPDMRNWAGHNIGKCQIVACSNLTDGTDGTVYLTELPTPLLNRFFVFKLTPNKKDAMTFLKTKYKNIPQVAKYIKAMQDANIAPRDIDQVLNILQYDDDSMFVESKLGSALTSKLYDLQKNIQGIDPAQLLTNAKTVYSEFQDNGTVIWAGETITTLGALKGKFEEIGLSAEEIQAIVKGE